MSHTITLDLPDHVFRLAQRTAQATHQSIEGVLVHALQASLPPLDGLLPKVREHLTALEMDDDESLWRVLGETVPRTVQRELTTLLARQQEATLTTEERERLALLQARADLVMLRKARAAVLLRFRGRRLPTLIELNQRSLSPT